MRYMWAWERERATKSGQQSLSAASMAWPCCASGLMSGTSLSRTRSSSKRPSKNSCRPLVGRRSAVGGCVRGGGGSAHSARLVLWSSTCAQAAYALTTWCESAGGWSAAEGGRNCRETTISPCGSATWSSTKHCFASTGSEVQGALEGSGRKTTLRGRVACCDCILGLQNVHSWRRF
jgi:hypothetical protein